MPIPIATVGSQPEEVENNHFLDFSFLANHVPVKEASFNSVVLADQDADQLMKIWLKSEKVAKDTFRISSSEIDNKDLLRLKSRGFLCGGIDEVKFTAKAKTVISMMALGESNNFLKNKKDKSYSEILASVSKKGKKGYRMAEAYDENSHLINLKK